MDRDFGESVTVNHGRHGRQERLELPPWLGTAWWDADNPWRWAAFGQELAKKPTLISLIWKHAVQNVQNFHANLGTIHQSRSMRKNVLTCLDELCSAVGAGGYRNNESSQCQPSVGDLNHSCIALHQSSGFRHAVQVDRFSSQTYVCLLTLVLLSSFASGSACVMQITSAKRFTRSMIPWGGSEVIAQDLLLLKCNMVCLKGCLISPSTPTSTPTIFQQQAETVWHDELYAASVFQTIQITKFNHSAMPLQWICSSL